MTGNHWFDERTVQIPNSLINLHNILSINSLETLKRQSILGNKPNRLNHLKRVLKFAHLPIMYGGGFWENLENVIIDRRSKKKALESVSFDEGNFFFPQNEKIAVREEVFHGSTNLIIEAYADSLVGFCNKKNIKVFLCIPPSFDKFPPTLFNALRSKGYEVIIPVVLTKDYFSDNTHLNEFGAVLYSKYLREMINQSKKNI
jgi:hypothetical protein